MLHTFNKNLYTDFRTAYKYVLIPSSSDLTEPKYYTIKHYFVAWRLNEDRHLKQSPKGVADTVLFFLNILDTP